MNNILAILARTTGVAFLALAFFQWLTFDYPNVNPFFPGAILAPGMLSQVFNSMLVGAIAAAGILMFRLGDINNADNSEDNENEKK